MRREAETEPEAAAERKSLMYVSRERALYLGVGFGARLHAKHALTVCLALKGTFWLRTSRTSRWERHDAAVVAPDQPHQTRAVGTEFAFFYFLPESVDLARVLRGCTAGVSAVAQGVWGPLRQRLGGALEHGCSKEEAHALCAELLGRLGGLPGPLQRLDARVTRAIDYLRGALDGSFSAKDVARAAWASHSRLAHLFKEQTGVALRRYEVWVRLCAALERMATCRSLTQVAHEVGFYDYSHLNRVFLELLGVRPKYLRDHSRVVVG